MFTLAIFAAICSAIFYFWWMWTTRWVMNVMNVLSMSQWTKNNWNATSYRIGLWLDEAKFYLQPRVFYLQTRAFVLRDILAKPFRQWLECFFLGEWVENCRLFRVLSYIFVLKVHLKHLEPYRIKLQGRE
jgi:hypothetical protein